jgi:hypothetical protein
MRARIGAVVAGSMVDITRILPLCLRRWQGYSAREWNWRQSTASYRHTGRRVFKTGLLGLLLVGVIGFGSQLAHVWGFAVRMAHTDQVHYGGHLLAGRLLSLWPGTAELAENQYARGLYHARTPAQAALLTTQRPTGARARLAEARLLAAEAARQVIRVSNR